MYVYLNYSSEMEIKQMRITAQNEFMDYFEIAILMTHEKVWK